MNASSAPAIKNRGAPHVWTFEAQAARVGTLYAACGIPACMRHRDQLRLATTTYHDDAYGLARGRQAYFVTRLTGVSTTLDSSDCF